MKKKCKNYVVGSTHTVDDGRATGMVLRKLCWQCRKTSVIRVTQMRGVLGESERCLNDCGPEGLGRAFSFGSFGGGR